MKICMLVTNSLKKDPRVQKEARLAHENGHDVIVLGTHDKNYDKDFLSHLPYKAWIYPLNQKYRGYLKSKIKKFLRMWLPIYNLTKKCIKIKPDIIHANDFDTLPSAYLASILFSKSKIVYDSHEIYTGMPQLKSMNLIRNIITIIERFIIRRVDRVVSVSNAAADVLGSKYKIERPTVVTNCPFYSKKEDLMEKNPFFEVIYQGIMSPHRGYEEYVESAKYLDDDIKLVLRGFGSIEEKLKKYITDNKLSNEVRFDPPVEISELVSFASRSHVGVILTKPVSDNFKYTVSNKIFECIQARIPVILSNVPEHVYLNNKYKFGIVLDSVTPKAISEAINSLYANKSFYNELRENATIAAEELCWEIEGMKLIEIYNDLK
ncbi:MAG: glycosyltransferase [Candidatus Delongbacteria bacterium]|nr:glycosyltransferase [Candidatus Delongbacteria bacterium]